MATDWTYYEGHSVGGWRLDSFLGMRGHLACYVGTGSNGVAALLQLVPSGEPEAAGYAQSWETARRLTQANLMRAHDTGTVVLDGVPLQYAALDLPDDDVAEMMSRRSLSAEEVSSIVAAAADALDYLHVRGLQHGSVCPLNILFAGSVPKLSIDTLTRADVAGRDADLNQLAASISEMTAGERTAEAGGLPAPLRRVVAGCRSGSAAGWTAARVRDALVGNSDSGTPHENSQTEAAAPQEVPKGSFVEILRQRWPVLAIGLASLIAVVFIVRPGARTVTAPMPPSSQGSGASAPASAAPSIPAPSQRESVPPREAGPHARARARSNSWAVIAATYNSFDSAQKRARKLLDHSRGLHVHVYPRQAGADRYYVVLGSGLTETEARKLRSRAVRNGAPRDTYVTRLPES